MNLPYELARRHYHILRRIEYAPGSQSYAEVIQDVADLPLSSIFLLWEHHQDTYQQLIPFFILARRYAPEALSEMPASLQKAMDTLKPTFLSTLIQEQERLIQDAHLYRYLYARYLILDHMHYWGTWEPPTAMGLPDRDQFRQLLGAFVQVLSGLSPHSPLLEIWNQTAWLQRWQINDTGRQDLPTQRSPRKQIEKYRLPERAKRLYAELDQGLANQENFVARLPEVLPEYVMLENAFQHTSEQRVREVVQVVMRHAMKKGFRVTSLTTALVNTLITCWPESQTLAPWLNYTLVQELILGTQNLKYRLNDVIAGIAHAELPASLAVYHSVLDCVMEIYESFSLADNAVKSFLDQSQKAADMREHEQYLARITHIDTVLA